jgi:teichuronic acid exporter
MQNAKLTLKSGILWNSVQLVVNQVFGFAVKLVLAKLLLPEQFGLIGMASVFIGFVQILNDIGIGAALIQRKSDTLRKEHYSTAFWTGLVWAVVLYCIIVFIVGPIAAVFYEQPMLTKLVPVLSLGILSSPINLVHKAQLTRSMDFKRIALIENTSNIMSGLLALLLAYSGAGVWSLAFNSIASLIIAVPLYFRASRWVPSFTWEKQAFKDIFGFGIYTTGTNVVNYWMLNVDYLLIGKFFSPVVLGIYTLAFLLTDVFRMKMMAVINTVMYPWFSQKQDDLENTVKYYSKVIFYNCLISYPVMIFLIVLAEPFIISFFGEKWIDAIVPLRILALSVMFHIVISGNNALIRGRGMPGLEFKLQLIKSAIYLPMLFAGIYYFGIIGAAWVVLINKVIAIFFAQYALKISLKINTNMVLIKAIAVPSISAIVAGTGCYFLEFVLHANYIFSGVCMVVLYGFTAIVLKRDLIQEIQGLIKR